MEVDFLAVKIRLKRGGKHKQPRYRIVAIENSHPRDGKILENLGFYSPQQEEINLHEDRIKYWLSVGAKASDVVQRLLANAGMIEKVTKVPVEPGVTKKEKKAKAENK
jgi:small subunit ribosomal protein S16